MKELLFVYGTLTDTGMQQRIFGRMPMARPDRLPGFEKLEGSVAGTYPEVRPAGDGCPPVPGLCLELTPHELQQADRYETDLYFRSRLCLESGREAWVYQAAGKTLPE